MNLYQEKLQKLSLGFCRLKGIDVTDNIHINDICIEFDEWDWEVGVGLYGFWRYAEKENSAQLKKSMINWYNKQTQKGLPKKHVNSTSPMLVLCLLCKEKPNKEWHKIIVEWANYLLFNAPKTKEGGLQHTVKERNNDGQLWDDTLFMAVLFLWVSGDYLEREDLKNEALFQFLIHTRFLSDPATSLWYHGWTFEGNHHFANAFWARGNAWITMAIPELIRLSDETDIFLPLLRYLKTVWKSLMDKVISLQQSDGSWNTLLDDDTSPIEMSATAGFAYALSLGLRLNILPNEKKYIVHFNKAREAVVRNINVNGFLEQASDGTAMGHDLQFYRNINNAYTPYAQAMAMLLLCED